MSIQLTHLQKHYWIESKILDNIFDRDGNPKPINGKKESIEKDVQDFAKKKAIELDPIKYNKKNAQQSDEYRFIVGAMMETLAEFYLKLFEISNHDLRLVEDTSENKYEKGYDFIGVAGFEGEMKVQIQIKWRAEQHLFSEYDLYTMLERAKEENIFPRNLYLVVISSTEIDGRNVLHYKEGFRSEYGDKMRIITGRNMMDKIYRANTGTKTQVQDFWENFKKCLNQN